METIGDNLFQVKKERSYISCLLKGNSYGFKHLGMLLRYMWPSLVLTIILPIPFVFFFAVQIDAILRKWIELGYLPNVTLKSMRHDIEKCANRSVVKVLIYMIWLAIIIVSFYVPLYLGLNIWYCLLFPIIFWVIPLPLSVVIMQISYSEKAISECFKSGMRIGYRNYGKLFAFDFLNLLLLIILLLIGSIPYLTTAAVLFQSYQGVLMGEAWNLPVLFPLYVILADFLSTAVLLITILVFSFSRCLMWGSLVNEVPTEAETHS